MKQKYTIKQILTTNQAWWIFFKKHENGLRKSIPLAITKLLSCRNKIRGFREYHCSNPTCPHTKLAFFTCKAKSCSSCGKKATEIWMQKQGYILPDTSWQHITFTMPNVLWDFFWLQRELLNVIAKFAAECVQKIAHSRKVIPGIFIAIHTFGRDLKRNVHIHLSVTLGGISLDHKKWVKLFFNQNLLMSQWRYKIIKLFRDKFNQGTLILPKEIQHQLNHSFTFKNFLDKYYNMYWHVHCAKPTNSYKQTVKYLSKYIKRPAIAESRLKHYDGHNVIFRYLNHKTKTSTNKEMSVEQFIGKFIQHIPDANFRMIRYYGFLSNRLRGTLLPTVRKLLKQETNENSSIPTYVQLMMENFNINPLICLLCGSTMKLSSIQFGITNANKLLNFHQQLALLKSI